MKIMLKGKILIIAVLFIIASCSKKEMTVDEYLSFVQGEESGLIVKRELTGIKYSNRIEPIDFKVIKELNGGGIVQDEFDKIKKGISENLSVIFLIEDVKGKSISVEQAVRNNSTSSNILAYSQMDMKSDFSIEQNGKTIPCQLLYMEPVSQVKPIIRIALDFGKVDADEDFTIVFNDNIFNNGVLKFHYNKNILTNLPTLKL